VATNNNKKTLRYVKIDAIKEPKVRLNDDVVVGIQESIKVHGLLHPLLLKPLERKQMGAPKRYRLLSGAQRLQAVKLAGFQTVPCLIIDADEQASELVGIIENLHRKHLSVLKQAELTTRYWQILALRADKTGKVGNELRRGRPRAGLAQAARLFPAEGRSEQARRKAIERAFKIASISPEAKKAARKAKLQNNQSALLAVAKAGRSANDQLNKVRQCAAAKSKAAGTRKKKELDTSRSTKSRNLDTSFTDLEKAWDAELKRMWAYAPASVRLRFVTKLRDSPCKTSTGAKKFVKSVLAGRPRVRIKYLFRLANEECFRESIIKDVVQALRLTRTKTRTERDFFYRNPDKDWRDQVKTVSDEALAGTPSRPGLNSGPAGDSYYESI
jgi:ParB/RepB/Spo0J family partition protein